MIDQKTLFISQFKIILRTDNNITKTLIDQGDDYTTGCLLDYNYLRKYYKMIAINLSQQQALDADPKAIQQINFTENVS